MAVKADWSQRFNDPIPLPKGRQLVTLKDAGNYITKLPKAEHKVAEWQAAMEALILVATSGGPTMFARIGVMRALNRGHVREFDSTRKDTHWGQAEAEEGSMTDQEVLISTLREARRIIGEHTGPRNANQTLTQLIAVLDRQDVAHAIERLEKGHEFRDIVK